MSQINETPVQHNTAEVRLDILRAFGADLNTTTYPNLIFVNNGLCYPVGKHIAIRDVFSSEDSHRNDLMFIYLEDDVNKITSLNVSRDNYLLLVACELNNKCEINVYNLTKLSFTALSLFQPKRKVISSKFKRFIYASFSTDGNCIACIAENKEGELNGVVYDVQSYKKYTRDNYTPKYIFDLPKGANKITYENKVICTSGKNHLSFWFFFEGTCKEYKSVVNVNKNYVDHEWLDDMNTPSIAAITDDNELIIFNALYESNKMASKKGIETESKIERFTVKQMISNLFSLNVNTEKKNNEEEKNNNIDNVKVRTRCTVLKCLPFGVVIGSTKGNVLFLEKAKSGEYVPIRFTYREKEAKVTSITVSALNYEILAISFDANEIAYISLNNLFSNLKNEKFEINFNVVCDGFHSGEITTMDVAQQRPIIITTSRKDKTVRVWNYLTGHCEYCKIILEEKDNNLEKEMQILSVAIHPNGYYIAISDVEMIRFFHLCYKELRFYNNDQIGNEPNKANCELLKFSNGGHLLAAVSEKKIYIIRSYSRETVRTFNASHTGTIIAIFFHNNDNFLYSSGSDGVIVQYNLFDFNTVKIANKYINYTDSGICSNYYITESNSEDNILSCGFESVNQSVVSSVKFIPHKTEEIAQCQFSSSLIDSRATAICNVVTKRYEINAIAIGSENGTLSLYSPSIEDNAKLTKWDSVKSHRGPIRRLFFSKDTNLLFSSGDDGNLFIYAIYEYPDGETAVFEDNKNVVITQLNSILDEGLGDNVLISLIQIAAMFEQITSQKDKIFSMLKAGDETAKNYERLIKEKESEINKKRENEAKELRDTIAELNDRNKAIIDQYENQIKTIIAENRAKYNAREQMLNEKIDECNAQISDMKKMNEALKEDFDKIMTNKEYDHLRKFHEFEYTLQKRFKELENRNEILTTKLTEQEVMEKRRLEIIENEHETEIVDRVDRYNQIISKNEKEIEEKSNEIAKLKDTKLKLEKTIASNESTIKKYKEDNERLLATISNLRVQLDNKESEKEQLTKKLSEIEQVLQEKSKLEGFSNQLKNELYKKNFELSSKFNNEIATKEELKESSKELEKQLEDTILLLINREKEMNKQKILIDELKQKWEMQKHETNLVKKDFDNLLKKIYDTFQTNDKKMIINGIREIYHRYLSLDAEKNFDSNKLNINVRAELEKHIDFLQKELNHVSNGKAKKEKIQVFEYQKKMQENAMLIEEMTRLKKMNAEANNEIKSLKFKNLTLVNEMDRMKTSGNYINSSSRGNINTTTVSTNTGRANTVGSSLPIITNKIYKIKK